MSKVEDFIQHYGVKGMKWGVRRYQPYPKGEGHKGKFIKKVGKKISDSRVGQEVRSASREIKALRTSHNLDNMSTKDIKKQGIRLQKEAEMKRLTKRKLDSIRSYSKGSRKDRKDYRNRGRMSDQEIDRKLERLRAKNLYSQNADKVTKKYVDVGKKVVESATSLGITYATNGGNITVDDVFESLTNPRESGSKNITKTVTKTVIDKYKR